MDNQKNYYVYDPETHAYAGMVRSLNQPESSTEIRPIKVLNGVEYPLANAKFDPQKNEWIGKNADYQTQVQLAQLTSQVQDLSQQVAILITTMGGK